MLRTCALAAIIALYSFLLFTLFPIQPTPPTLAVSYESLLRTQAEAGGFALGAPVVVTHGIVPTPAAPRTERMPIAPTAATSLIAVTPAIIAPTVVVQTFDTQATIAYLAPTPAPPSLVVVPTPQPMIGVPNVIIQEIAFDGAVYRAESDEYVNIANIGTASINVAGWKLNAGDAGQDFIFPNFELWPGQSCRVYTNELHVETCGFSFRIARAIWNNQGDCGYLSDASGSPISSFCYQGQATLVPTVYAPTPTPPTANSALSLIYDAPAIPVQPVLPNDLPAIPVQPDLPNDLPAIAAGPFFPVPTPLVEHPHKGQRYGAICRDGWHSNATDSGACSHHQGVSYWLVYP